MINVAGLTFSYPSGSAPAIRDMDFTVREGEVFGFLGPSGAGKSTTQNILIGLLTGWDGSVKVAGKPIGDWGSELYRLIGVSFEFPNHYLKLTARENLEYFRSLYEGDAHPVEHVMRLVGLEPDIDKIVGEYSKGMKNRLNFARSLLHRPKLWFLDEPTTGLDPVNAVRIRQIVREQQQLGVTTLITTHDMQTAQEVCDRVAFIIDGKIEIVDSPTVLRRRYGKREVEVQWGDPEDESLDSARYPMDGLSDNADFLQSLRKSDLASVHSLEASLEDVFVQVTGRTLQ